MKTMRNDAMKMTSLFAVLALLALSGCRHYYILEFENAGHNTADEFRGWVLPGPKQAVRVQIKNKGEDGLFLNWIDATVDSTSHQPTAMNIDPTHSYSVVQKSSVFEIRPSLERGDRGYSTYGRRKTDWFPKKRAKSKAGIPLVFQLQTCRGDVRGSDLPYECTQTNDNWKRLKLNARVRLVPEHLVTERVNPAPQWTKYATWGGAISTILGVGLTIAGGLVASDAEQFFEDEYNPDLMAHYGYVPSEDIEATANTLAGIGVTLGLAGITGVVASLLEEAGAERQLIEGEEY